MQTQKILGLPQQSHINRLKNSENREEIKNITLVVISEVVVFFVFFNFVCFFW